MKKVVIILLSLILLSSFVLADESDELLDSIVDSNIPDSIEDSNLADSAKDIVREAAQNTQNTSRKDFLDNEVKFPDELEFLATLITWITGKTSISWSALTVYIMILITVFVFFLELLTFTPFETPWVHGLIALGLSAILVVLRFHVLLVNLFYNFLDNFKTIMWTLVIILGLMLLIRPVINKIKEIKKLDKAEQLGIKTNSTLRGLNQISKGAVDVANKK